MKFVPSGNYILVKRLSKEEVDKNSFIVPDHLKVSTKAIGTEIVSHTRKDEDSPAIRRVLLAVEATMLEDIEYKGHTFSIIQKQYVKGEIQEDI